MPWQHLLPGTGGGKYSSTATRGQAAALCQPPAGAAAVAVAITSGALLQSAVLLQHRDLATSTNSKQQRPGPAGSVAKSWLFSHILQQNLHTLKWNTVFFFFAVMGLPELRLCIIIIMIMSHIIPGISQLQVCKTRHHLKQEKRMERARLMDSVITGPEEGHSELWTVLKIFQSL